MSARRYARSACAAVVAAGLVVGGCAVMTVDVDVYQGPLADHKDVQTEQLAVMAVATEPLLKRLILGVADRELTDKAERVFSDNGKRPEEGVREALLRIDEIPDGAGREGDVSNKKFTKWISLIRSEPSVEEIIAVRKLLYPQRSTIGDIVTRYQRAYDAAWAANDIYSPKDPDSTEQELRKKLDDVAAEKEATSYRKSLAAAYKKFFIGFAGEKGTVEEDWRDWRGVINVLRMFPVFSADDPDPLGGFDKNDLPDPYNEDASKKPSSNEIFIILQDNRLLKGNARFLFPNDEKLQQTFVSKVKGVSRAFIETREQVERAFLQALDGVAATAAEPVKFFEARQGFAKRAAKLIQITHLRLALEGAPEGSPISNLAKALATAGQTKSIYKDPCAWWGSNRRVVEEVIVEELVKRPVATVAALKAAHERFKSQPPANLQNCSKTYSHERFKVDARRRYGIVSATSDGGTDNTRDGGTDNTRDTLNAVAAVPENISGESLSRGRLSDGIFKMIEDYLTAVDRGVANDVKLVKRDRLLNALVRYGHKVRTLANTVRLVEGRARDDGGSIDKFIRVLQTIGNSLVVHVDAIRNEESFDKRLRGRAASEVAAIESVWQADPWNLFDRMTVTIYSTAEKAQVSEEEVRAMVAAIRDARVETIKRYTASASPGGYRGAALKNHLLDILGERLKSVNAEQDSEKKTKAEKTLDAAIKAVKAVEPPSEPMLSVARKGENALQVFDTLVDFFRHERLRAVRDAGTSTAASERAAGALVDAYRQRSDMIYLRPALAYLRTSYTATTLQDNRLAWQNMLERHGFRTFIPGIMETVEEAKAFVGTEIDKQFWQNINRVRLAGAGDTNYAIVKDDIGNWYVKGFSTDVDAIIQAAGSLATFGVGGAVDQAGALVPGASGRTESTLMRQRDRFTEKFNGDLRTVLANAKTTVQAFPARIGQTWANSGGIPDADQQTLQTLATPSDDAPIKRDLLDLDVETVKADDLQATLGKGLKAIRLYHDKLVGDIRARADWKPTDAAPADKRVSASKAVTRVVLDEGLRSLVDESASQAATYLLTLTIITESADSDAGAPTVASQAPATPY